MFSGYQAPGTQEADSRHAIPSTGVSGPDNDHTIFLMSLCGPKISGPENNQIVWSLSGPGCCLVLLHRAPVNRNQTQGTGHQTLSMGSTQLRLSTASPPLPHVDCSFRGSVCTAACSSRPLPTFERNSGQKVRFVSDFSLHGGSVKEPLLTLYSPAPCWGWSAPLEVPECRDR